VSSGRVVPQPCHSFVSCFPPFFCLTQHCPASSSGSRGAIIHTHTLSLSLPFSPLSPLGTTLELASRPRIYLTPYCCTHHGATGNAAVRFGAPNNTDPYISKLGKILRGSAALTGLNRAGTRSQPVWAITRITRGCNSSVSFIYYNKRAYVKLVIWSRSLR